MLAACLAAALALTSCSAASGLRHEAASLPTRDVLPVDQAGVDPHDPNASADQREQLLRVLLTSQPEGMATDRAAAQAVMQRLKRCGVDCLQVTPPVVANKHSYLLATASAQDPDRPGAAFAFLDEGDTPRLVLVATGYEIFLGLGAKDTIVAMAGSGPGDTGTLSSTSYRVQADGRLRR